MTHINKYINIYKDKIKYFKIEILNNKETSYLLCCVVVVIIVGLAHTILDNEI